MSITVKFTPEYGQQVSLVVPYEYGDYTILALNLTCEVIARRRGENYIRILEEDRAKNSNQRDLLK